MWVVKVDAELKGRSAHGLYHCQTRLFTLTSCSNLTYSSANSNRACNSVSEPITGQIATIWPASREPVMIKNKSHGLGRQLGAPRYRSRPRSTTTPECVRSAPRRLRKRSSMSSQVQSDMGAGCYALIGPRRSGVNLDIFCNRRCFEKVTIIIKGRSTPCTTEKTYEATADAPLPSTFIDGSYRSGPEDGVVIAAGAEVHPGGHQRVEIYLRYIETTLLVRRVGKYLAFSAKLPEELVESSMQDDDNLQLCTRGCPLAERLDLVRARGHVVSWEAALAQCRNTEELSNDIVNNLTDYYLDWCVFDAMTAGVGFEFTAAAHSAQADVLRMDPSSLQNRTVPLHLEQTVPSRGFALQRLSSVLALLLVFLYRLMC
ncbi:hypothetical protein J6590_010034 [Homalodisca vitripennis]|nr:hypothetical protein J6590_010034 [Homalodisca vitripennis]